MFNITEPLRFLCEKSQNISWITRFAPSPTGNLHLGHIASAMLIWLFARKIGGKIVLRIEDHDRQRSSKKYETSILEDLKKLGFFSVFQIGFYPKGLEGVYRQSDYSERYQKNFEKLREKGLVYACNCSRKSLKSNAIYPGNCATKNLPFTRDHSIRFVVNSKKTVAEDLVIGQITSFPKTDCGDFVIKDRNGNWSYQFCVVCDDYYDKVNLVIRGEDILESTGRQIKLEQELFTSSRKKYYLHHPLLLDEKDQKLGKKIRSLSIKDQLSDGITPNEILGKASFLLGLTSKDQPISLEELFSYYK